MKVRLVLMRNRKRVWATQLRETEATLGRANGCTVRIPSSQVSRLHCRLHIANGVVTAEDLESVNGTFINGNRIRDPEVVHPGDRLSVGPVTFLVEYELSTTTLQPLSIDEDEDSAARETDSDVYLVKGSSWQAEEEPPLVTVEDVEVVEEPRPPLPQKSSPPPQKKSSPQREPVEVEVEGTDVETVPLAEQDEIHLADSGTLRDFLIELDNADSHPGE